MRSTEARYRTLLDASSTLADQPTVKAVLHSLRDVLSSTSRLHGTELYVLNDAQDSLRVLEFDRDPDAPAFKIGTKVSRIGAAARVLEEQKPVFVPDTSQEGCGRQAMPVEESRSTASMLARPSTSISS